MVKGRLSLHFGVAPKFGFRKAINCHRISLPPDAAHSDVIIKQARWPSLPNQL